MAFETDLIRRYTGAFTKDDCEKIIHGIKFFDDNHLLFYDTNILDRQDHRVINVTHEYDFSMSSRICEEMFQFLIHDLKLKEIPAGGGFHAWHYENGALEVATRQFVIQVYLNDDFDGGETEFLYQQRREKAVTGDVLIFPASYTHTHRGNPPLGGVKYLATSWGIIQNDNI